MRLRAAAIAAAVAALTAVSGVTNAADLTVHLALQQFATGLTNPIAMAVRPTDTSIYVAEQTGQVVKLTSTGSLAGTVLDISSSGGFTDTGGEQGLLGLTFNPAGDKMFVYFTSTNGSGAAGSDVLREYDFDGTTATLPVDLLKIPDPEENHNGGNLAFKGGLLYIGTGDGGGAGDQHGRIGNGQNIHVLLGKMLRIAPTASGYRIPRGNPFVGRPGRDEIWDYGLRNPWRWSFDRATGDLWIGDVGQNRFEEIDVQGHASTGGWNFGWRRMEGNATFPPGSTAPPPARYHKPIYVYSHAGRCAVIGGYVYRGSAIATLQGAYLFSDLCDGMIRAFDRARGPSRTQRVLDCPDMAVDAACQVSNPSSFGQDANGELYVLSLDGQIYKLLQGV